MIPISGYQTKEKLYESNNSYVYRSYHEENKRSVIIKILKGEYPSPERIARFKREYEILRDMKLDGVVKEHSLEKYNNSFAIIMEDFGAESLEKILEKRKLNLNECLELAIKISEILGEIHQANIIHKDINPSNIVWNPKTNKLKIIDFGISTVLLREITAVHNPDVLEGTLAYISPEQTGRMNRMLDYRTDLYSLGVTFYEMLTNQLPFPTKDAMELVHCHIAKEPVPPNHEKISSLAGDQTGIEILSRIIMKLLSKTAEERYHSAFGLNTDLRNCLEQLNTTGEIKDFVIAQKDISDRFQIPQKLYGREKEIEILLDAFDGVCRGKKKMMTVTGYAGIGKSVLVNEIHKPVVAKRGYFISGKYDQFKRNIPYSALIQAFQQLIKQILTEKEEQITAWKEKILNSLGPNGQVIIDVIPELEHIIGKQAPVPELPSQETQNRFNLYFQNFIGAFTSEAQPLSIFLDDLQWIDLPSLNLLELFMTDIETQYIFIIGAYRDNEVDTSHPLLNTLDEIIKAGEKIQKILLDPLDLDCINQLLADTLNCSPEKTEELSKLCLKKTNGNPFFLKQYIQTLYEEKFFKFDYNQLKWHWEIGKISKTGITDNVVDLMVNKIEKLSRETQTVLKLASSIGNQFNLETLSMVYEKTPTETTNDLWIAIQEELILPVSGEYKLIQKDFEDVEVIYRFSHDRILQAAYTMIDEDQKKEMHLKIGQLLLANTSEEEQEEKIFDIVNQLNAGIDLIDEQSEKDELRKLNEKAGKKAKTTTAYDIAVQYYRIANTLMPENSWEIDYNATLALYTEWSEAEYLARNIKESENLFETVLQNARSVMDKVAIYFLQVENYSVLMEYQKAIDIGIIGLKELGISLPKKAIKLAIILEMIKIKIRTRNINIEDLIHLQEMTDPLIINASELMIRIGSAAYMIQSDLMPLTILKVVSLSIKYGISSQSPYAFSLYGAVMLAGFQGKYNQGYEFSKLGVKLADRYENKVFKGQALFIYAWVFPWKNHLSGILKIFKESLQYSLENGDLQFAAWAYTGQAWHFFLTGDNLEIGIEILTKISYGVLKLKNLKALYLFNFYKQTCLALLNETNGRLLLQSNDYNEEENIKKCYELNDYTNVAHYLQLKTMLYFLYEEYSSGLESAREFEKYEQALTGLPNIQVFYFYYALVLAAVSRDPKQTGRTKYFKKLKKIRKKYNRWGKQYPVNYAHKCQLITAEEGQATSQKPEILIRLYDEAIKGARENEYTQDEAIANECAARYFLSKGMEKVALTYLSEARTCYVKWGAKAKVEHLDEKYPKLLPSFAEYEKPEKEPTITTTTSSVGTTIEKLDLATVQKASQAISGEIHLDKLLQKLIKIVITNAGAQKGFLILETNNELFIEAEASADKDEVFILQHIPVTESKGIPQVIINYVLRTNETVVIDDAVNEGNFTTDDYIIRNQTKSIFCIPLIYKDQISSILYLENNLSSGSFTSERVELLQMLSGQLVISIENAQLYRNLEEINQTLENKVRERTAEISQKNITLEQQKEEILTVNETLEHQKEELQITLENLQKTQSQLVESEKMAALGSLVAGVAHEINTPVGISVTAASSLAEETKKMAGLYKTDQISREDFRSYLQSANQSANLILANMERTASMVQSFKQVSVDQSTEEKRSFLMKKYTDDVIRSLYPKLKDKGIHFDLKIDEDLEINSYPGVFAQILTNLIINSINHGFKDDREGVIDILVEKKEDNLNIEYKDNGVGITEEILPKIFDPFFTSDQSKGTGLGLNIVYNLVTQKLGGEIKCESEEEEGVVFGIEVPIGRKE